MNQSQPYSSSPRVLTFAVAILSSTLWFACGDDASAPDSSVADAGDAAASQDADGRRDVGDVLDASRDTSSDATGPSPDANLDVGVPALIELSILRAFPTAMGAGMFTTGGRGGKTFFVNTIEDLASTDPAYGSYNAASDTYSGTLRYCLVENREVTKNIVFLVGGEFILTQGDLHVNDQFGGNISLLGQTARDLGGVHITGSTNIIDFDNLHNFVLRFVDFKPGHAFADSSVSIVPDVSVTIDGATYPIVSGRIEIRRGRSYWVDGDNLVRERDGMNISRSYDFIVDHVSAGWHGDESFEAWAFNLDGSPFRNITVQRSLFLPGIRGHNVGGLFGHSAAGTEAEANKVDNGDFHHNCFINLTHRFPNIGGGTNARFRVFNNVIYGWGSRLMNLYGDGLQDVFNNHYTRNPSTAAPSERDDFRMFKFDFLYDPRGTLEPSIYVSGNYVDGYIEDLNTSNWRLQSHFRDTARGTNMDPLSPAFERATPIVDAEHPIEFEDAFSARRNVLNDVGANVVLAADRRGAYLDEVDARYLEQVNSDSGPARLPSSEDWISSRYPSGSASRGDFDDNGVPLRWTRPSHVINTAGYSDQELYFAEMAGDFLRL
jgi:hypothetical protein